MSVVCCLCGKELCDKTQRKKRTKLHDSRDTPSIGNTPSDRTTLIKSSIATEYKTRSQHHRYYILGTKYIISMPTRRTTVTATYGLTTWLSARALAKLVTSVILVFSTNQRTRILVQAWTDFIRSVHQTLPARALIISNR